MEAAKIIHESQAAIKTAAVTIKAVTIDKKQMTLSVFKQLPLLDIITPFGQLYGDPWGIIGYCPESSGSISILWQHENRLCRCRYNQHRTYIEVDGYYKARKRLSLSHKIMDQVKKMLSNGSGIFLTDEEKNILPEISESYHKAYKDPLQFSQSMMSLHMKIQSDFNSINPRQIEAIENLKASMRILSQLEQIFIAV